MNKDSKKVMDILTHLTDLKDRTGKETPNLFYSNLYSQDDTVSFAYKFKFGNT